MSGKTPVSKCNHDAPQDFACKVLEHTIYWLHSLKTEVQFSDPYKNTSFTYIFIWVRILDSDSLTKTKNWSGRNEVIETSGRLHPLWPQDKRLHTPRTTDYRHTGQDRWIQTELVFILAKNATKPNSFEIIPLQTTRKENNWKTEEALAQAAVTLETERIKGYTPWCLWWWWWWWRWWWKIKVIF